MVRPYPYPYKYKHKYAFARIIPFLIIASNFLDPNHHNHAPVPARVRFQVPAPASVRIPLSIFTFTFTFISTAISISIPHATAMQVRRTWTTKHWCKSVIDPEWPFAYSKYKGQQEERKGKVLSNRQDVRHECETRGAQSKCHICEDIQCAGSGDDEDHDSTDGEGSDSSTSICQFQLQGVSTEEMSKNIPTVSDTPWAVGGSHRYDYGGVNTTHICMHMSGGDCPSSFAQDYSKCELRCWGHSNSNSHSHPHSQNNDLSGAKNTARNTTNTNTNTAGDATYVQGGSPGVWPNARNDYLKGVNMTPWTLPSPTQTWSYPTHTHKEDQKIGNPRVVDEYENLQSLPQGLTFTLAGDHEDGTAGFQDGLAHEARFNNPEGVAVDNKGYVFVADTGNHAIRMISPLGNVTTIAGNGEPGFRNGYLDLLLNKNGNGNDDDDNNPQFTNPSAIAVWYDWEWWPYPNPIDPDSNLYENGNGALTLFVSDTGNHQIRKLRVHFTDDENTSTEERLILGIHVECFSGYCSTEKNDERNPRPGYSDGSRTDARFDSPRGLAVRHNGDVFVADTNNHLIRRIDRFGMTETVAGSTEISELNASGEPLEGCPWPCLKGVQGRTDGNSLEAKFSFPSHVALSANTKTLFVTDQHVIRSLDLDESKVDTIAGTTNENELDGFGSEAGFNKPEGVTVTSDGYIYISDSASCRIRRAFYAKDLLPAARCSDSLTSVFRPPGCSSYNADSDVFGLKVSSLSHNIYYNYVHRNITDETLGEDFIGRGIKDCVGSPPVARSDVSESNLINKLVMYDSSVNIREDSNEGSMITILCPPGCTRDASSSEFSSNIDAGDKSFAEGSSVCEAAIRAGVHGEKKGGLVHVIVRSTDNVPNNDNEWMAKGYGQIFTVKGASADLLVVNTISGASSTLTTSTCGQRDSIPPQGAKYRTPIGISVFVNSTLDNLSQFLYVADRNNNVIRALTATCSFTCENDGRCIGADKCECKPGWEGIDCTKPKCSQQCSNRQLCVAPDKCECIPGYTGDYCAQPTCVQSCEHGICSAPDTCTCNQGWFDTNCTTPVCEQTCGNGGNCTDSNTCTCPSQWKGRDCRTPVCKQQCGNGICVAPNTCQCPPDWSGFDCSRPVCHQGHYVPTSVATEDNPQYWLEYRPCNMTRWCAETNSFECHQNGINMSSVIPLSGPKWRHKTGKKLESFGCTYIELAPDVITWFQYMRSLDNTTTPYMRYSIPTPHNGTSKLKQDWNTKVLGENGFTSPWTFSLDRQVALVELMNITQGRYACANNGRCINPDTCSCPKGWMGFDCRVPICEQGYYEKEQTEFVTSTKDEDELEVFEKFMAQDKTYRLDTANSGYSNPSYQIVVERFVNGTFMLRSNVTKSGEAYLNEHSTGQGGYECSIRAVTEWEDYRSRQVFEHPNYYSHYMDQKTENDGMIYTHWIGMGWEPLYVKSVPLELKESSLNITNDTQRVFLYTDEGYKRLGEWSRTQYDWTKGKCIVEFRRVCDDDTDVYDLEAKDEYDEHHIVVQDTDLSFRARLDYDDMKTHSIGVWRETNGICVDQVIRGCFNNGTCVGPNKCECTGGWMGGDCTTPICEQTCLHNGNCTLPNTCTCERGWGGYDCSVPLCAQDCNNGGICVAPDTCQCHQWENRWRDGRAAGGVPLFQTPTGNPQLTGWTGYDCSTPICVQAQTFLLNVDTTSFQKKALVSLGGHGKNGMLSCDKVKCPEYNAMVISNNGKSFQTGCGNDPILTGCCYEMKWINGTASYKCFKCKTDTVDEAAHSTQCTIDKLEYWLYSDVNDIPSTFQDRNNLKICGSIHNPGGKDGKDYYFSNEPYATPYWNNRNYESNLTSDQYLCNKYSWVQGDYIDNAGLGTEKGVGSDLGLESGRHMRVNYNNYLYNASSRQWETGKRIIGEGIFACYNSGSCIAPDTCTCKDGYDGFDCQTPLCRHQQLDGTVVGCLNGGICVNKDTCDCILTESILWMKHSHADRGITGWHGQDCSNPICTQGYYDPFCTDNPQARGGGGCYRCANAGLCVAPDVCECSEGWTGFDCQTPVCEAVATPIIRKQLMTNDERKIQIFETDPCGMDGFDSRLIPKHARQPRGKCSLPNQCTCFCKETYNFPLCRFLGGNFCEQPFHDPIRKHRSVLAPNEIFGTRSCTSGFEGAVDTKDKFISCHLIIYEPSFFVRHTIGILCWSIFSIVFLLWVCFRIKRRLHTEYMSAIYDRRRFRRSGIVPNNHAFAFKSKSKEKSK